MSERIGTSESHGYVDLAEACKLTPGRPSTNCMWRWCRRGVLARSGERIRLCHVRAGGKIFTTAPWVEQFVKQLAAADARYFDAPEASAGAALVPSGPGIAVRPAKVPRVLKASRQESEAAGSELQRRLKEAGL